MAACAVLALAAVATVIFLWWRGTRRVETPPPTVIIQPPETTEPPREPGWELLLVNPWNPLPEDFFVELEETEAGYRVDNRITEDLKAMLADAQEQGLELAVCSAYRSNAQQRALYENKIRRLRDGGCSAQEAKDKAGTVVAVPGTSEHETGLALDIVSAGYRVLEESQADTTEQQWLMENAHRYGFILRYPADKTDITGITYEPWHYRYVGREAAGDIHARGESLEEYLEREYGQDCLRIEE